MPQELKLLTYDNFSEHPQVLNAITTRKGGVSKGVYHSLNLALHVGDSYGMVVRNREILSDDLGIDPKSLTLGEQIHGSNVFIVKEEDKGRGALGLEGAIKGADSLITNLPNIPLVVLVADCAAVSLYDPIKKVAAIAHAGWRGASQRIVSKTTLKMVEDFGSKPSDIIVGVSPAIGPSRLEVGKEVYKEFKKSYGPDVHRFFAESSLIRHSELACPSEAQRSRVSESHSDWIPAAAGMTEKGNSEEKYYLNLWLAIEHQLINTGVLKENIEIMAHCTACDTDNFYSHRAEHGKTGRFAGLVMIKEQIL
ncbi:MAG: hypothetical protein UU65_C0002G0262 [candidate division CPR2 bacterium GW2011_GWC1_41_48]|uniref:Purine nucleoside phosphorylase n=1 Tax=candidate division CPR2 bacterium GW2011_GWC1_41_48 TaxID=1618344 RepID=A0A0G0W905_UNCC2|nr:MAG: hypothetical protein UT47_C0002G0042 [candidate division CPR2 bacterium GW2011_GWC2_39_35]KKR28987.1 MAG: hypothetical protein UT60_C0008G0030 [candidate division CPR2 bacterium GW2011_GWD2_39_7]KKR29263.1 MAG: hypothetical protein UT59_C0010G0015 [candidate division CPR2 bacterium GW2011_GWD1_39_7]KKS09484.1 MAG: hypothetical protein UU65_C0002G0262 [candidate division CPR2 bacterium GW2011_GWC1_41_48]OGB62192.1 MAG: hypothetical protein A2Y27_00790 [candidate division CPR2 bacterium G